MKKAYAIIGILLVVGIGSYFVLFNEADPEKLYDKMVDLRDRNQHTVNLKALSKESRIVDKLEESNNSQAVEVLIRIAQDKDFGIPSDEAIYALGHKKHPKAVKFLIGLLGSHELPDAFKASKSLAKIGEMAVVPLVASADDANPQVRQYALEALYEINDPRAFRIFLKSINDANPEVQKIAIKGMERAKIAQSTPNLTEDLLTAVKTGTPEVQLAAIKAIEGFEGKPVLATLMGALKHSPPAVQLAAAENMGKMASVSDNQQVRESIFAEFESAIHSKDWNRQKASVIGISTYLLITKNRLSDQINEDMRLRFPNKSNFSLEEAAKFPLIKYYDQQSVNLIHMIIEALDDQNWQVRKEAAKQAESIVYGLFEHDLPKLITKLQKKLGRHDLAAIAGAYEHAMRLRLCSSEDVAAAIEEYGDFNMARDLVNNDDPVIKIAVRNWADKNGYVVSQVKIRKKKN
ncbi:MAG TPA: HEAT repeat domain-containing protein [Desulfobacteraceae bacterium]|nr:HEAT repeat domain-containing protein [Desulfobacteraceae bacterium]HPJ67519.1 HEAT repeat domain-containing protein [Desulfobacteraceae bacterium]HPQ29078.1 HEAT repeat domain-containing protein [Desulfobacteraceae bacterium]